MKFFLLPILLTVFTTGFFAEPVYSQTPVTDIGAGIQREALWTEEKGILSKINWYNVLIEALNGDIKGLTGEILGIDQKMLTSLEKVSTLIKDYKRVQETRELLGKVVNVYTEKLPLLVQDENFTNQQAAVIVESFDIILDDSRQLVTTILNTILQDDLFMMDDKQRYDTINEIYTSVKQHYGTISYLYNKLLYTSYVKSRESGILETFALYYSLYQ
ncbi:hypothetical protein GM418_29860 [Maribellus comscasis]|uniref:Conjugative transposon protein TraI n=1 Tax=Maribellus comscasis TaxID=2681766 RepID=A0A6I6K2T3_9BACT|nr:hypothetical protein [Maribellus comscasis]QGY47720.1 hypothetical protein GM418_29860 [Maribellus comscasis]